MDGIRLDGLTLLVIEDDADIRLMTSAVLRGAGALVAEAASGHEAQQQLAAQPINGVILDWNLLDVSGEDFLGSLKQQYPAVWAHCLVITGDLMRSGDCHVATNMGRPVLAKPFRPAQLLGAVAAMFSDPRSLV